MNISINVSAPIYPTESPQKVEKAISNIFSGIYLEVADDCITGRGDFEVLKHYRRLLRRQEILDAARSELYDWISSEVAAETPGSLIFYLNKQAAFVGTISFIDQFLDSLGEIAVEISAPETDLYRLIDWLTPRTKDGEIIEEIGDDEL